MPKHVTAEPGLEDDAHHWARAILRVEMTRREIGYKELAEKLDALGLHENERNLRNKVARGEFSAAFMLLCLKAMECGSIDLSSIK
jgi:hypothetical protein